MTTDHPEKQRGGRREGAGRKPTLQPLKAIRLHDPAVREALCTVSYPRSLIHERFLIIVSYPGAW